MDNNQNNNSRRNKPQHQSLYDSGGRMQPRDLDLEAAVLGALMLASKTLLEVVPNIHPVTMLLMVYTAVYRNKAIFPLRISASLSLLISLILRAV